MDLLLDTHTLLWYYLDDPQLSATARALVSDPANRVLVSPASYWEIAIKVCTKKYTLTVPFPQFIQEAIHDNGFVILPIEPRHAEPLTTLPRHHNDPFDRLIIAQAIVENMPVVGCDVAFDDYPVRRLW
jgi:PIN domain nuclease of toxin-antitoxin system